MVKNYKLSVNVCAHGFLALKLPLFYKTVSCKTYLDFWGMSGFVM